MTRKCSCGRVHRWSELSLVGVQRFDDESFELRNCGGCGSTLAEPLLVATLGGRVVGHSSRLGVSWRAPAWELVAESGDAA